MVTELGRRIVGGEFEPGEILDLARLEQEMRFGRTALRETMKVLASKGLIDARQGTGTFVTDRAHWNLLDPDLLRWHYETQPQHHFLDSLSEFRFSVEPAAAGLAAERRSDEQLQILARALGDMGANFDDRALFTGSDLEFHATVLEASGNEFFVQLEPIIEAALFTRVQSVQADDERREETLASHRRVFDAIADRNSDGATAAMRHLLKVARQQERLASPETAVAVAAD